MRENGLKEEDLKSAHDLKQILTPHGLNIDDAVLVPKLIKHVQESHMNPAVVSSRLKSIDSLSSTISTLKQDITTSKNQLKDTQSKLTTAEKQIMADETRKKELEDTLEKLHRSIDEKALAVEKLEDKSKKLTRETEFKEKEIMMADCLSGALLTNMPLNIDALCYCASELKNAKSLPQEKLLARRKNYEPQIKELLKKAFLSEFFNEFTSNKDHQTVIENWNNAVTENRLLREKVENLEIESTDSKNIREKLEKQINKLQKEIDTRDELYYQSHPSSLDDG
jgi:septal ring factor EnvC (AmiA/AmiB activator)